MSEIKTSGNGKKAAPRKIDLRVDFTPLVDMNMLLLTFFMFTTTLSKPQVMELVLPTKDVDDIEQEDQTRIKDSKAVTLILGADNIVYYYFGRVTDEMYENPMALSQTDYSAEGLRAILLDRNADVVREITELKRQRFRKEISEEEFEERSSEIKSAPDGQVVVIKPTSESTYVNLVDALDEMQICSIGRYALVDPTEADDYLLNNYLSHRGEGGSVAQN